jgi:O-antigen/teichoic acid export membrane protein
LFDAVNNCCIALFNAAQHMHYSGVLAVTEEICFTALALAILGLGGGLTAIVACRVIAQGVSQSTGIWILTKKLRIRPGSVNYAICKRLSKEGLHFFGVSFFTSTARNVDTVLLLSMQGPAAVGFYAAATKIVKLTTYFSKAFSDALYPVISKQAALQDRTLLATTYREAVKWIMIGVVPFVAFATVQSTGIMRALYGPSFVAASFVFQIFAWRAALGFLTQFCGSTLYAMDQQRTVFKATGIAAGTSFLLYLILIPRFSYTGAAFAAFATLAIEFLLQFPAVHRRLKSAPLEGAVFKPLAAGVVMALFCFFFQAIPLIPLGITGLVVYSGCLVLLGAVSKEELEMLLRLPMAVLQRKAVREV